MKSLIGNMFNKDIKKAGSAMTVQELVARFPEIPGDLHNEPLLAQFASSFGELLRVARDPSACSTQYDAGNHYYLKLVAPMKIYMYGLSTKEKVLQQLQEFLDQYAADPEGFVASLLPDDSVGKEVKGSGCL